ncbi:hypothetical protein CDAR_505601 [Caerostris darwini]|uniref:Uncharacterized protein n=1 Tax=Caerostris darwini TaxID=1538125 RepID=A0AAV4PPX9_9ARAC|nr:hypothetical protein CDAR_505601 [Caerostris darwini]
MHDPKPCTNSGFLSPLASLFEGNFVGRLKYIFSLLFPAPSRCESLVCTTDFAKFGKLVCLIHCLLALSVLAPRPVPERSGSDQPSEISLGILPFY